MNSMFTPPQAATVEKVFFFKVLFSFMNLIEGSNQWLKFCLVSVPNSMVVYF
jgi:hypothetical protein